MKSQDWREGGCRDDGGGPSKSMCTPGGLWRGKGWAWLGGGDVSLVLAWFNFEGDSWMWPGSWCTGVFVVVVITSLTVAQNSGHRCWQGRQWNRLCSVRKSVSC